MALTAGSLFSGIGGIDIGFMNAGFSIAWAIEKDAASCKTYRHNFPTHLFESDIRHISPESVMPVDVLLAGFPCQPFSVAGKQLGFRDERGNLFFEILRFADAIRPTAIFLENVPNLAEHDNGRTLQVIHNAFAERGYYIRYQVMRASEFGGIPQIRDRIYMIAFRSISLCEAFDFPKPITLNTDIFSVLQQHEKKPEPYYLQNIPFAQKALSVVKSKQHIYRVYHESIKPIQNAMCPTLTASMGSHSDQIPLVLDDFGVRKLTLEECLRFQGFPNGFHFPETVTREEAYKQIGNSVCVPVVERIAKELIATINQDDFRRK